MATSGYFTKTLTGSTYKFYIYYKVQSQNNITGITKLYVSYGLRKIASNSQSYNVSGSAYLYATVNGTKKKDGAVYFDMRTSSVGTEKSLYNTTVEIQHDSDGKKTVELYGYLDTAIGLGEAKISAELELPKIAMASGISATDAYIGAVSAVTVNRLQESYTHSIAVSLGSVSGWLNSAGEIVDSEVIMNSLYIPFTIPESFYYEIPDSSYGDVTLMCTTYANGVQVGEPVSTTFKAKCDPSVCSPTGYLEYEDIDETATSLSSGLIRYVSDVELKINAEAQYGASIVSSQIMGESVAVGDTLVVADIPTGSFNASVTDSRGFTTGFKTTGQYVEYFFPTITVQGKRQAPTSNNVDLSVFGNFFAGRFGQSSSSEVNSLTVSYRARTLNGEWGESKTLATYLYTDDSAYSFAATVGDIDYRYTYEIEVTATDMVKAVSYVVTIPRGIPVYDWGNGDFRFHVPLTFDDEVKAQTRENLGVPTASEVLTWKELGSWTYGGSLEVDFTQYNELMFVYDVKNDGFASGAGVSLHVITALLSDTAAYLGTAYRSTVRFTVKITKSSVSTYTATYDDATNSAYKIYCFGR